MWALRRHAPRTDNLCARRRYENPNNRRRTGERSFKRQHRSLQEKVCVAGHRTLRVPRVSRIRDTCELAVGAVHVGVRAACLSGRQKPAPNLPVNLSRGRPEARREVSRLKQRDARRRAAGAVKPRAGYRQRR